MFTITRFSVLQCEHPLSPIHVLMDNATNQVHLRTRYAVNTPWREIGTHGCYSLAKIKLTPIWAYNINRRRWRHNNSTSRPPNVTGHLWWRQNANSEKPVLGDNGKVSDRQFLVCLCVQAIEYRVINQIRYEVSWITNISISWGDSVMTFSRSFVTRKIIAESHNSWQKSLFTVT